MTDGIRDALGMDSKNRENRDGETIVEASELRTLRQQLHQERERAERADRDNERLAKYAQDANQEMNKAKDRAEQAEARCNHLTNECANLAQRNAQIERERDELAHKLADKDATEMSYLFRDWELHDMASSLASELEEEREARAELDICLTNCRRHIKVLREMRQGAERQKEEARRERDRYATILGLASRFAAASPETQIKDDGGGIIDGRWLASHICDVLEGEA